MARSRSFMLGKRSAKAWLAGRPPKDNYWPFPPDEKIAELIRALNALPFLYTHSSCGGHLRTKGAVRALLVGGTGSRHLKDDDAFGHYSGAWFSFEVDGSAKSARFLGALRDVVSGWSGASLTSLPGGVHTWGVQVTGANAGVPIKTIYAAQRLERLAHERIAIMTALARRHRR